MKSDKRIFLVFMIFAFSAILGAVDATRAEISLSIRYFDMRINYTNADPIFVQVTLTNNSPGPYRFKLADERAFSLDFDVRTTTNRPVEAADILIRRRTTSQQIFFREVLIESGESFSFVEDLRNYARLDRTGNFVVQARIYPELFQTNISAVGAARPIESNRLSLTIRPPLIPGPDGVPVPLDVETGAILVRERLPPDEVINFILTARQREQWERFFLYLDLEAMISRDAYRRRQWQMESEEGRRRMLDRYRLDLQGAMVDGDISTIPREFIIERTVYGPEEGTVTVLAYFQVGTFTERKRYTYYLRRRDDIWSIVDYVVVNLGTE